MRFSTKYAIYMSLLCKSNKQTRKLIATHVNAIPDVGDKVRIDNSTEAYRVIEVQYEGTDINNNTKSYTVICIATDAKNSSPKKLIANMRNELITIENMLGG